MSKQSTPAVKYVIVKRSMYGRNVAVRGLSYATEAEANAKLQTWPENYRKRFSVETRHIEADDSSERMTCQCCGGKYLARLGTVTHHGYERPGGGYQTASCMGAKFLPFEKDHARLDMLIVSLGESIARFRKLLKATKDGSMEISVSMTDYNAPRDAYGRRKELTVQFTSETFAAVYANNEKNFKNKTHEHTFEAFQNRQANHYAALIKQNMEFKRDREAFRKTWKHTHNYNKATKEWVAL